MKRPRPTITARACLITLSIMATGCDDRPVAGKPQGAPGQLPPQFIVSGMLENKHLDEASGIQAGNNGFYYTHNDSGDPAVFVIDESGSDFGKIKLKDARNKDWEDITRVPWNEEHLLVLGDIGDNESSRKTVQLYFVTEPRPGDDGRFSGKRDVLHKVRLRYPDGSRDCEAMAYDASSGRLLFLTKRDKPPHLYAITLEDALENKEVTLNLLGTVPPLRPPSRADLIKHPRRGMWIGQPTGMDISADGRTAAVIGYRSLYVYQRNDEESWLEAFQRPPTELIGPPGLHQEAVGFSSDAEHIIVTTERRPAPVHRIEAAAFD